jgi:hypothetical protein
MSAIHKMIFLAFAMNAAIAGRLLRRSTTEVISRLEYGPVRMFSISYSLAPIGSTARASGSQFPWIRISVV